MSRAAFLAVWLCAASVSAQAAESTETETRWTVAQRMSLPVSGQPIDLARLATAQEESVRIVLEGTLTFGPDGSGIDAMGRFVGDTRDVTAGPFVIFPPGAVVVDEDPVAHRYTVDVPRTAHMPLGFNVLGLATRHLMTATEARSSLIGAIEVSHLVPPPPPPPAPVRMARAAAGVSPLYFVGGGAGLIVLFGLVVAAARRRKDPIVELLGRAARAKRAVAREVVALGPAFDPVAASAERLHEAALQHSAHHASIAEALGRTAKMASDEARARRRGLEAKMDEVRAKLRGLVARLEDTATELAGRNADTGRACGVEAFVAELGADLEAAVEAEEELALR